MECRVRNYCTVWKSPPLPLTGNYAEYVWGYLLTSTVQQCDILAAKILSSHDNTSSSGCRLKLEVHSICNCLDAPQISSHSCFSAGLVPSPTWAWVRGDTSQKLWKELAGFQTTSHPTGRPHIYSRLHHSLLYIAYDTLEGCLWTQPIRSMVGVKGSLIALAQSKIAQT